MDSKLLKQLYERYARELYLYIYSFCHSHSMAEDIRQETFLKAILSLSNQHTNMKAWLYVVARNLSINAIKKEKRVYHIKEIETFKDLELNEESLLHTILTKERNQLLYHALDYLPAVKKEILILQYFSQLSQKEIATILHITPENVRVLSYRAKKELKLYLEENGYDIS